MKPCLITHKKGTPTLGMKITENFWYHEFRCKDEGRTHYPEHWMESRLLPLCELLEVIRAALGNRPVRIDSGYRTPAYNRKVGGVRYSQHLQGRAADIVIRGVSAKRAHDAILHLYRIGGLPALGGLGLYPGFVHVDIRPTKRLARWSGKGVRT